MLFTKFTQAHASFGQGIAISSIGYFWKNGPIMLYPSVSVRL